MSDYVVRRATEDDRDAVIALVGEMWNADVRARYEWMYAANPHGKALTWIAFEGDDPVAVTSIFPRRVRVAGAERVGSIGGDCYVRPRARRRGLATRLHRATFAEMRALGVDFMYGPPRPNNLHAMLKAGSHEVTAFRRWSRPLTGDAAVRAATKRDVPGLGAIAGLALGAFDHATRPAPSRWSLERARQFGPEHTRVLDAVAATHRVFPLRDAAWLTWRYLRGPSASQAAYDVRRAGELVGVVALEREANGRRGVIVDVAVPNDAEALDAVLERILGEARALGCDAIDASLTPGTPLAARLARRGFVGREEHAFQVALASDGNDAQRAELLAAAAWTFTDGDKDMDTVFSPEPDG